MPFTLFAIPARAPASRRMVIFASRAMVFLLILTGAAALLGWVTGLEWLTAPVSGWRGLAPSPAICSIALGVALWGRIHRQPRLTLLGASLALVISILALLGFAVGQPLPLGGMPLPSAILVGTAAVGLLGGVLQLQHDLEKITLGLAGLALIALTVTVTFARAIGVFDVEGSGMIPGSSLQLVVTMLLLGVCFVGLVWVSGLKDLEPPEWLPVATGLASLIAVMSLWSALAERERAQGMESSRQAATTEERLLRREIESTTSSLRRAAGWAATGAPLEQQQRDLLSLQRDIPSTESGFRLAGDGTPLVLVPLTADVEPVIALWRTYLAGVRSQPDTAVFLPLDSVANRFVIFAPVCARRCDGVIAAVIRSSTLFQATLRDTLSAFRFSIAGPAGPVEGSSAPDKLPLGSDRARPLRLGAVHWTLSTWPVKDGTASQSNLPGAVLFMGLIVTVLLPVTIQLGRSAWDGARARERARLSLALDRATDGLWEVDLPTGQAVRSATLWKNLRYEAGTAPPDFAGWTSLIHPEDQPGVEQSLARHLAGESESYETEYRVRAGDGSWHTVIDRGRIVDRTTLGTPARLLGISADVTEARAATKAREDSERRFRALFNSGFQFQILLGCDCKVLEVNQVALDHFGTQADNVLNQEGWNVLWWSDNPAAQQILRSACESANSGRTEVWEQEIRQPGRPAMILEISLKPIQDAEGKSSQLLLEGRDITERRRAEAGLKEVDTLTTMGRVAARVAHEINNPLAGIKNAFLLIKDAVPEDHPHFSYVGAIEREIDRISNVTRQLYETYRPEQDSTGISSVQLVVTDAVAFLEQVNRLSNVRIVTDIARVPGAVPVPAAILRQIIYNLVQNAIDASPAGGTVTVIAGVSETALELRVQDQGPGVPTGLKEQIFEPFFSTKEKEMKTSGMGLGLALVRRTVAAAGGTIAVDTLPAGGAEFVVVLPLGAQANGSAA